MRVQVGDWQRAGAVPGPALTGLPGSGLMGGDAANLTADQPSMMMWPGAVDVEGRAHRMESHSSTLAGEN
jgi:hypothetical protein